MDNSFSEGSRLRFGGEGVDILKKIQREAIEKYVEKLREGDEKAKNLKWRDRLRV